MNETQTMRCALYVRKACAEEGEPIESLAELCDMAKEAALDEFGRRNEADIKISLYMDMGISGLKADRPGLSRLIRDIEEAKVDAVAFQHMHHLSRSEAHLTELIDFFTAHGVTRFFLCNPAKAVA